jgi:hypothetical protein
MVTTEQIVWTLVIALAALVLIGLIVAAMRKKSLEDKRSRAQELRQQADGGAAGLPDAQARADQAAAQAEHKRLEAERAEREALAARTEVDQERARHEDQLRAADRLDPDVNHKAKDYAPHVPDPVGPGNIATQSTAASTSTTPDSASGEDTIFDRDDRDESDRAVTTAPAGASADGVAPARTADLTEDDRDLTDTSPREPYVGTDDGTLRDRLDGDPSNGTDPNGDARPDGGGAHRA